ncbi:hypothetical protein MTR67_035390 [Solanum verrucosum]|uniref:CCHC-type domain-containing protein n=1 Tax=Solanum verrucosum TaxID=315347 RepID=A0AAF0ZLH7_SOLVR|nr:hypothetical protein MTR67_035390 [Solanum verrucosum]
MVVIFLTLGPVDMDILGFGKRRCGKNHPGESLGDSRVCACFGCGKIGHRFRDFPSHAIKGKDGPQSEDEHVDHLRIVLQILTDHQLFVKYSICEFRLRSAAFPGHIVTDEGIKVDPKKTDVVKKWLRQLSSSDI